MEGDEKAGFTIFFADDGLDTGPVLLMRETAVEADDTVSTLYVELPHSLRPLLPPSRALSTALLFLAVSTRAHPTPS